MERWSEERGEKRETREEILLEVSSAIFQLSNFVQWFKGGGTMKYARMVSGTTAPDKLDDVIRLWHEFVAPSAKQQKGFINARLLVNRESGQVVSMGLWESETDFQNSVQWNAGQLTRFTELFPTPLNVHGFELAGEA